MDFKNYKQKYLKYKQKYFQLKMKGGGGKNVEFKLNTNKFGDDEYFPVSISIENYQMRFSGYKTMDKNTNKEVVKITELFINERGDGENIPYQIDMNFKENNLQFDNNVEITIKIMDIEYYNKCLKIGQIHFNEHKFRPNYDGTYSKGMSCATSMMKI